MSLVCNPYGILYFDWPSGSVHFFGRYGIMLIYGLLESSDVYMHEEFVLAYFVAKREEKNGIFILSICLICYVLFCIYFADLLVMPVLSVVAFIFQLIQVMCRCCLGCYNILMFLMMI